MITQVHSIIYTLRVTIYPELQLSNRIYLISLYTGKQPNNLNNITTHVNNTFQPYLVMDIIKLFWYRINVER